MSYNGFDVQRLRIFKKIVLFGLICPCDRPIIASVAEVVRQPGYLKCFLFFRIITGCIVPQAAHRYETDVPRKQKQDLLESSITAL